MLEALLIAPSVFFILNLMIASSKKIESETNREDEVDGVGGVLLEEKEEAEEPHVREESLLKRGTSKMSRALVRQPHTH